MFVYSDKEQLRFIYILLTKEKYTVVANYDDLKSCLRKVCANASLKRVSCFTMPRIGVVDDNLEWANVAICLETIFQEVDGTFLTFNTPEVEQGVYAISFHPSENILSEPNNCTAITSEEVFLTESVKELFSWTRSDSELAKRQRADSATEINLLALERYCVNLEVSHCTFGTNPISCGEALFSENLEALELWSNW